MDDAADTAGHARRRAIEEFAQGLKDLWTSANRPSLRTIARDLKASGSDHSKSTIGDVLNGVRRPPSNLLGPLVSYLQGNPDEWMAKLADLDRRLDALDGRPAASHGHRRRVQTIVAAAVGLTGAGVAIALVILNGDTPAVSAGKTATCPHITRYEIYRPNARLLTTDGSAVGYVAVGDHFDAYPTGTKPYDHRYYGYAPETKQWGWIDQGKIRHGEVRCADQTPPKSP
jgi:hypothetical protein